MTDNSGANALENAEKDADQGFNNQPATEQAEDCPIAHPHTITIELVDALGNPVADEKYRIEAGNGEIREAILDKNGKANEESLAPGDCKVSFPDRERNTWEPYRKPDAVKKDYIELSLVDENDEPLANEPYLLELPDGSVREGKLDADGFVREEDTGEGPGRVWFYKREVEPLG